MTTRFKRSGGRSVINTTGRGPKHLNEFAFRHNKHSKLTKVIQAIPNEGLCPRCVEIIEWRKKFRKYKMIKEPKKCATCSERRVLFAYHLICQPCAQKEDCCAKCKGSRVANNSSSQTIPDDLDADEQLFESEEEND
jgi:hypothetical protein